MAVMILWSSILPNCLIFGVKHVSRKSIQGSVSSTVCTGTLVHHKRDETKRKSIVK